MAYEVCGLPLPLVIRAHSTRIMAAFKALLSGVSFQKVCDAASWASPHSFIKLYSQDIESTSGSKVLETLVCTLYDSHIVKHLYVWHSGYEHSHQHSDATFSSLKRESLSYDCYPGSPREEQEAVMQSSVKGQHLTNDIGVSSPALQMESRRSVPHSVSIRTQCLVPFSRKQGYSRNQDILQ